MTYRIRAHHGMCFSFFRGKGYNEAFIKNMQAMKDALSENPEVILLCAADDVCACCPNLRVREEIFPCPPCETHAAEQQFPCAPLHIKDGVCVGNPASPSSGQAETYDRQVLAYCGLHEGTKIRWNDFVEAVKKHILIPGKREDICDDCLWNALCR